MNVLFPLVALAVAMGRIQCGLRELTVPGQEDSLRIGALFFVAHVVPSAVESVSHRSCSGIAKLGRGYGRAIGPSNPTGN